MKFKVKDLRDYLHLHGIPTQTCREKEELVDLVLGHRSPASAPDVPLPGTAAAPPSAPAPVPPPASPVLLAPASDVPTEMDREPLTQEDNQVRLVDCGVFSQCLPQGVDGLSLSQGPGRGFSAELGLEILVESISPCYLRSTGSSCDPERTIVVCSAWEVFFYLLAYGSSVVTGGSRQ